MSLANPSSNTNLYGPHWYKAATHKDRYLKAGLLARSHYAFGRSCDRPSANRVAAVILCPAANAQSVTQFIASPETLTELTSIFSPKAAIDTQNHKISPQNQFLSCSAFLDADCPISLPSPFAEFYLTSDLSSPEGRAGTSYVSLELQNVVFFSNTVHLNAPSPSPNFIFHLCFSSYCIKRVIILPDNFVCHSPPLLNGAYGRSAEWTALIRQASRQEVIVKVWGH